MYCILGNVPTKNKEYERPKYKRESDSAGEKSAAYTAYHRPKRTNKKIPLSDTTNYNTQKRVSSRAIVLARRPAATHSRVPH